ncbi:Filamin-A [Trichoplax sp. H2]|nr:Filamin-A [Trichoplax sp. H2]|eukprot:RDD41359.1 Filamin-A [Trichoplax sp. H2]
MMPYYREDETPIEMLENMAEDAEWKRIQKNTFTRWCNQHLKTRNLQINDLFKDFADGLKLIALLEILSGRIIKGYHRKISFPQHKIENVSTALRFVESLGISLISIDSGHIIHGNSKLILGLIWKLILHFQISLPTIQPALRKVPEDVITADNMQNNQANPMNQPPSPVEKPQKVSAKQALLNWVNDVLPKDYKVNNFTRDWNDGIAIQALVDNIAPGLCPEYETANPHNALENATVAMERASDCLDVPMVLTPEDMVNPKVDEKSVMTYVSFFPEAKLKPGVKLPGDCDPTKVKVKGRGIQPTGLLAHEKAEFIVDTRGAGEAELEIAVVDPNGRDVDLSQVEDNGDGTYTIAYNPTIDGNYVIDVIFYGQHVPKSPFHVEVQSFCDPNRVRTEGPGLASTGVVAGEFTYFNVLTKGAGSGEVAVEVFDSHGASDYIEIAMEKVNENVFKVEYKPLNSGLHTVKIFFGGKPVRGNPHRIHVQQGVDPSRVRVHGPGIEPRGVIINRSTQFTVDTSEAGDANLEIVIENSKGRKLRPVIEHNEEELVNTVSYTPTTNGMHRVTIRYANEDIPGSPYEVDVASKDELDIIKVYGRGLHHAVVNKNAYFTIETLKETTQPMSLHIEGPSEATVECYEDDNAKCDVAYVASAPGQYSIHILFGEKEYIESPYLADMVPAFCDPSKCNASGPGLDRTGLLSGTETEFIVDTSEAGLGELMIAIQDSKGNELDVDIIDNRDDTFTAKYTPVDPDRYRISIHYGNQPIPRSPFRVKVDPSWDASKCKANGPGIAPVGVKAMEVTHFNVDATKAGVAELMVEISQQTGGTKSQELLADIIDNNDGTFTVEFTPPKPGRYTVVVKYGDAHIPDSPYRIKVDKGYDASKCHAEGLGIERRGNHVGQRTEFQIDTIQAGQGELTLNFEGFVINASDPYNSESPYDVDVVTNDNQCYAVSYTPIDEGQLTISVLYGADDIPGSPFRVIVAPGIDPSKCLAQGPGLAPTGVVTKYQAHFEIFTDGAGPGELAVVVEGPSGDVDPEIEAKNDVHTDFAVNYIPNEEGMHTVTILFGGVNIPGSPFNINVGPHADASKCYGSGPGLQNTGLQANQATYFEVDTADAGIGDLEINIKDEDNQDVVATIKDNEDGTYLVNYRPLEPGKYVVSVIYADDHIPSSPYFVNVAKGKDFSGVQIYGRGLRRGVVDKYAYFTVKTEIDLTDPMSFAVEGPAEATINCTDNGDHTCTVSYVADVEGTYSIHVFFGDEEYPHSPYFPKIEPAFCDPSKCTAKGPGLNRTGLKTGYPADFTVDTSEAGLGDLMIIVEDVRGIEAEVSIVDNRDDTFTVTYTPTAPEYYVITILFGNQPIPRSPYRVRVDPSWDASKCIATGPGIEPASVKALEETYFEIDATDAGTAELSAEVINHVGPRNNQDIAPDIINNEDGTFLVRFLPPNPGRYTINVRYGDKHIPDSPYLITVGKGYDASQCVAEGQGLERKGNHVGKATEFYVHTSGAGIADLTLNFEGYVIHADDPLTSDSPYNVDVYRDNEDVYVISYTPYSEGRLIISVLYGSDDIPDSPFRVNIGPGIDPSKCLAQGDGLTPNGVVTEHDSEFEVFTDGAGPGELTVIVDGPGGEVVPEIEQENDTDYQVTYAPTEIGMHSVSVLFSGVHIPGSPFDVNVSPHADPSKCLGSGPGLERYGLIANKVTYFEVDTVEAGAGVLKIIIEDQDRNEIDCQMKPDADGTYVINYRPIEPGEYNISVLYDDEHIPDSPYIVNVEKGKDFSGIQIYGRGLRRGVVDKYAYFKVKTETELTDPMSFSIEGPAETGIECTDTHENVCTVSYVAPVEGTYKIHVYFGDEEYPQSPYSPVIEAAFCDPSKCTAKGPGLERTGLKSGYPADFIVDTSEAGLGDLMIIVEDVKGNEADVSIVDNRDDTFTVTYTPWVPDFYIITIIFGGENIPRSPYRVRVDPSWDASKCTADGPGIEPAGVKALQETYISVDASEAGMADLTVDVVNQLQSRQNQEIISEIIENGDGTFTVKYTPPIPGRYSVIIKYGDDHIPESPYNVRVEKAYDASLVHASGPGLERTGLHSGLRTEFIVDCTEAGIAELSCDFEGHIVQASHPQSSVNPYDVDIIDNSDGTYLVEYTPCEQGRLTVIIMYGADDIPGSPFKVNVGPGIDPSKCFALGPGLEPGVRVGFATSFEVSVEGAGPGQLTLDIVDPNNNAVDYDLEDTSDIDYNVDYTAQIEGPHQVNIYFAGVHIPNSPFTVDVGPYSDPSKCKAFGPGLVSGFVGASTDFTIDTTEAGDGDIGVTIDGPTEAEIDSLDNGDGTCSVNYFPILPGQYTINILFANEAIPNSPFVATIVYPVDASKCIVGGPGLENGLIEDEATYLTVDTTMAGDAQLKIDLEDADGHHIPLVVKENEDIFTAEYSTTVAGPMTANISYGDQPVPGSPFTINVDHRVDVSKIIVSGNGLENPVYVGEESKFTVDAIDAGPSQLDVYIQSTTGVYVEAAIEQDPELIFNVTYVAPSEGDYVIDIKYHNEDVPDNPFSVFAELPLDPSKVSAYGPGLEGAITDIATAFIIDTREAGYGNLDISVDGPVDAPLTCNELGDGRCEVTYTPPRRGVYEFHITYGDEAIPGSPFPVNVANPLDPSKCVASGPGIEKTGNRAQHETNFIVDTSEAGDAELEVDIKTQSGHRIDNKITHNSEGIYNVSYTPKNEGLCYIKVKYAGKEIPRSPFSTRILPAYDASKVNVEGDCLNGEPVYVEDEQCVHVDYSEAGLGDLTALLKAPNNRKLAPEILDNGDDTSDIRFVPEKVGRYQLTIKFGADHVPGSPFQVSAAPFAFPEKCVASGTGLDRTGNKTGTRQKFLIDAKEAGRGNLTASLITPRGYEFPIPLEEHEDEPGVFSCRYRYFEQGRNKVNVKFADHDIPGSPFPVKVDKGYATNPERVDIGNADEVEAKLVTVDEIIPIEVDATKAGPGDLDAQVKCPSGAIIDPEVIDNDDDTYRVSFKSDEIGVHEVSIKYANQHVHGSPFNVVIYGPGAADCKAYGNGLDEATVGEEATFTIDSKDAGTGSLAVDIEGPEEADIISEDNGDGTCDVNFVPTAPGNYDIHVTFNGNPIPGSPFPCNVTPKPIIEESVGKDQAPTAEDSPINWDDLDDLSENPYKPETPLDVINEAVTMEQVKTTQLEQLCDFLLENPDRDVRDLNATVISPSGNTQPCKLVPKRDGTFGVNFVPHELGRHHVNIIKHGKHIDGSPFIVDVLPMDYCDPTKVYATGTGLVSGVVNQEAEFMVNTRDAGYGGLGVDIHGPSQAELTCIDNQDGTCTFKYTPTVPGYYGIEIKFADQHIPGSLFYPYIAPDRQAKQTFRQVFAQVTEQPDTKTEVGKSLGFAFQLPNARRENIAASVRQPSGFVYEAEIVEESPELYTVQFLPKEPGDHLVSIKKNNRHIQGSPFPVSVRFGGDSREVKCFAYGPGLQYGFVNRQSHFTVWTTDKTAESFRVEIEGPSPLEIFCHDNDDTSHVLSYTPPVPGEYLIHVIFRDKEIPHSPYTVHVMSDESEVKPVNENIQRAEAAVGEASLFELPDDIAGEELDVTIISPSGIKEPGSVTRTERGSYIARFVPIEPGKHTVNMTVNGRHIPGSPFYVYVNPDGGDAKQCKAYGKGLKYAKVSEVAEFYVLTENAGPGEVDISIDGPVKTGCNHKVTTPGHHTATYLPLADGIYTINIKFAGKHVPYSPFRVPIRDADKPKPEKCIAEGPGLQSARKGVNHFTLDASDAGNGSIMVGVKGPSIPCDEIKVNHKGDKVYTVGYRLAESGPHLLTVKWGDKHIPGSPYTVIAK